MALNRNDAFNPNDTTWMDSGVDPSERGFISKSLRFIFGSAKGIVKGTAEGLLDNLVDEHLDKLSDAKDVFDSFTEAAGKATKELSDDLKEFKSAAREIGLKYTEGMAGAMPSGLYRRLSRAFEEPEDEDSYSPGDQLEASISSNLASIFSAQARHTAGLHHISMQSAATDRALAAKYHKQDMIVSTIGSRSAANIDTFLHSTYVNYLKKDLELKYRNLHLMRTLSSNIESLKGEFSEDGVVGRLVKNTNPLGQTVGEHARVTTGTYQRNFFSETLDNLLMTPSFVLQSLSGIMSAHASVPFEGVSDVVASITKHTAPWLLKKIGPKLISEARQKKLEKTWEKAKLGLSLLNGDLGAISKMAPMKMNALAKTLQNSDNWFMSMIGNMMPTFERNTSIANLAATNPKDPATFDNLTRETIVTIIPEHLSRIGDYIEALSKQQGIRIERGDSKVWDVRSRSFVTRADQRKRNLETIYGSESERKERYKSNVDAFVALTGAGNIDMHNTALKNQFVGKSADVQAKQQELVQHYQADLAQFIENSAYHLRELDIRALIACARNDEDGIQEEYLNQVFGTIDAKARNIASVIVNLVTNYDSKGRVRGINRVFMDHINKRIMDRAKEHNEYDDIRQQLRDQNQYDHEDYYFNMYGSGYLRENAFINRFRRDHAINGDVNVAQRVVDMARDEDVIDKLDERSTNAYKFARSRSKNARERLLHDQLLMNTGLASTSMIPGFLLRWINSAYGFTAEKFGETSDAISKAIENNELLNTVKSDIFSKHKNVIVGLRALRKDPKNPGNIIFRIQIKKKGEGSANNDDKLYSYKLTYEEWKNFTHVPDKPSRELKSFIDTFIDTIGGKKEYDVDWKTFKLGSEWPDKEESSAYEFNDVIYGSSRKQGGFGTSGQSLVHRYLDSIDRNLVDIRNSIVPSLDKSGDGGKRLSVHDQQCRFARFAKQRLAAVARLIESKAKEVKEQPSLGLEISSLYDEGTVKGAANELKTIEDTKEYEEIFASAIQSFEEQAFHYYLCHVRTRPLDGDDIEQLEEKYGINVQAKPTVPVFDYEDPVAQAIADKKSIKDPYAPMNNWLKSKGSAVSVSSNPNTVSTFKDGVEEIEHIVFSDAKIKAYKAMDELTGSKTSIKDIYSPKQQWEVLAKRVRDPNYFKVEQTKATVKTTQLEFSAIIKKYKTDAVKYAAYQYWRASYRNILNVGNTSDEPEIMLRLAKNPGFLKQINGFASRTTEKQRSDPDFTRRMSAWIKDNCDPYDNDNERIEFPNITPANFDIGATFIDGAINEWASLFFYQRYIKGATENLASIGNGRGMSSDWKLSKTKENGNTVDPTKFKNLNDYFVAGYARKHVTILRRLAKRLGLVKDSPVFKMTGKSFGLSGNTEAGNVIDSAAQKLGQDGWFANSETFNINPSSKGLSITPEVNAGDVITGEPSKLSSGYADGTYGRATLHAEGDESMIERFKKAKMFSALTGWIKALKSKKEDTNIVSEERKLEKAGFNPKDLIAPATLAVIADKLDIGNAIGASAEGGGGTSIFGIPTNLLRKVGHGLWAGVSGAGRGIWHGLQWTAGKIPGLGRLAGNAAKGAVKLARFAPVALTGAAMGLGSSLSSDAGMWSTITSTAAHAAAGVALKASSKLALPLIFISAGIAAQQGWTDKTHLRKTFGAMYNASRSQKGAAALGNILNDLTFGALKMVGAQKYIDRAIYNSGAGAVAGKIGSVVAGANKYVLSDFKTDTDAMSDKELMEARAKLKNDILRNQTGANDRLREFEAAISSGNWSRARELSGKQIATSVEKAKAIKEMTEDEDDNDTPMNKDEIKIANEAVSYLVKNYPEFKERSIDYKEAIESEQWRIARSIIRKALEKAKIKGDIKASIYLERFNAAMIGYNKRAKKGPLDELKDLEKMYQARADNGDSKAKSTLERIQRLKTREYNNAFVVDPAYGERVLEGLRPDALSDEQIFKYREILRRRIESGDQSAMRQLDRFNDAVSRKDWAAIDEMAVQRETKDTSFKNSHGGLFGWIGMQIGANERYPMSDSDIKATRSRLQDIIKQTNNPFAIQKLKDFDLAVSDENWKEARRISGNIFDDGLWGVDIRKESDKFIRDTKQTTETELAKRYRLIFDRVKAAINKPNISNRDKEQLAALRTDMEVTELLAIDDDLLNSFEQRLTAIDKSSGLMKQEDIDAFEKERKSKLQLVERQALLLKEIETAQHRCGWGSSRLKSELRRLYSEVDSFTLGDLSGELLDSYDEELRLLDSQAVSTKSYDNADERKMVQDRIIRRNTLLGNIDEVRSHTSWFNRDARNDLNTLEKEVKSMLAENITDEMFDAWDDELKSISPNAHRSKILTDEQIAKQNELIRKKGTFVRMLESAIDQGGTPYNTKKALSNLLTTVKDTPDDNLTDELLEQWVNSYKQQYENAITIEEQEKLDDEHAKVVRAKTDLLKEMSSRARTFNRDEETKLQGYRLGKLIGLLNDIPDEKITQQNIDIIRAGFEKILNNDTTPIEVDNNGSAVATMKSGAVEQAISLDRNGNIVDSQTGSATSVSLKTAPGGQIIHTHPDGSPTSATDIAAAIQNGQTAVTTLRSSGNVLGYSNQTTRRGVSGETVHVKRNEQNGNIELDKALTDMTKGMQDGFNSIDTNRDVLVGIYDRLGDVIDAVSEHNVNVNNRIDTTALKSYDLARKFTTRMMQKAKDVAPVFNRPSVINISK